MTTFISALIVIACFIIVVAVLLQPAKSGGLTSLGGSSQSIFGSTGGTTFLFRVTMWCAVFLMAASLFLGRYNVKKNQSSVFDTGAPIPTTTAPAVPAAPTEPAAPAAPPAAPAEAPKK